MNRTVLTSLSAAIAMMVAAGAPSFVAAQTAPDLRNIRPMVMLLVDSSGSMERMPDCECTTPSCNECLPNCAVGDHNRWATLLEAFNGSFDSFSCIEQNRSMYSGDYDHNYFIPHYEIQPTTQQTDGVLDVYVDRIRFALMTFDGIGTLTTSNNLVPTSSWTAGFEASSEGVLGMYSYGDPKPFTFPGCATDYSIDNGARNESDDGLGGYIPGNLISMGAESDDHAIINQSIQDALLALRPYGPTPTAALLDDFRYYMGNHTDVTPVTVVSGPGDPYAMCRGKFAVLVTDGYPNADMRGAPYNCDASGFSCPYERPEEIAADLCDYDSSAGECTGDLDGVFVVGFNVTDAAAAANLDAIAAVGGTDAAFFATDRPSLVAALAEAFDRAAPGSTTRTVPAFASTASTSGSGAQYQFNTGFKVGGASGTLPWTGVLERRRFTCDGTTVVTEPIDDAENDRFDVVLNNRVAARALFTALPPTAGDEDGWLTGTGSSEIAAGLIPATTYGTPAAEGIATLTAVDDAAVDTTRMNVASTADRDATLDWLYARGTAPAGRLENRLGDIYHSSPVVVGPSRVDRADESYNYFRNQDVVATRPSVVYVGTNDGILHAFAAEDHTVVCAGCAHEDDAIQAGDELWGFVPPMLVPKLFDAANSHQWMVDGTPVVRDVFYARAPGAVAAADQFRTVLLTPLRQGGGGVIALDVTDPIADAHTGGPKFLWQFNTAVLTETYGQPAIAQVLMKIGTDVHERAVAIIPAGRGTPTASSTGCAATGDALITATSVTAPDGSNPNQRTYRRCYGNDGRGLYVVDIATGRILRKWESELLTAPMSGGVSVYPGDIGVVATRAFMNDADGVMWRLDLSSADPDDWTLKAFHDMFGDKTWDFGQPAYYPPVLSVDDAGSLVILQATGDIDLLDGLEMNRIISITEKVTYDTDGTVSAVEGDINWTINLAAGELVTGPLELFDGKVYFGTFMTVTSATDACEFGESKLWGVHYLNDTVTGGSPDPGLEDPPSSGTFVSYLGPYSNQLIMGVAVTQRPSCFVGEVELDPYLGNRYRVTAEGGGAFQLVAQVGGEGTLAVGASIGEITRTLPAPTAYTQVEGYAGSVE